MRQRAYRRYGSRRKRRNFRAWALLSIALVLALTVLGLILFLPKEEGSFGSELKKLEAPQNAEFIPFRQGRFISIRNRRACFILTGTGKLNGGFPERCPA